MKPAAVANLVEMAINATVKNKTLYKRIGDPEKGQQSQQKSHRISPNVFTQLFASIGPKRICTDVQKYAMVLSAAEHPLFDNPKYYTPLRADLRSSADEDNMASLAMNNAPPSGPYSGQISPSARTKPLATNNLRPRAPA